LCVHFSRSKADRLCLSNQPDHIFDFFQETSRMTLNRFATMTALAFTIALVFAALPAGAQVKPGDIITRDNASQVETLVSPGTYDLVRQGMTMKIIPTGHLEWPPPYKAATERYSPQVSLSADGDLRNYVAGLPFPLVDVTDPQAATKIMWNYAFRPLYTDDLDARDVEAVSHRAGSANEVEHFSFGHLGFYNSVGRTEVNPMPTDRDVLNSGIASRSGTYPILEPAEMRGAGLIRERYTDGKTDDAVWEYGGESRKLRRLPVTELSDSFGVSKTGGRTQLGINGGSRFTVWFFRKDRGLQLPPAGRAIDARSCRGGEFSRDAMR
jgi:hypothetical protein